MITLAIGYDTTEAIAYHVCCNSVITTASQPIAIVPLSLNLFDNYKETHTDGSNNFVYTRFLVPHLLNYRGWAIYIDGDMLLRSDIAELWKLRDESKAVMVVKHDYKTKMPVKYSGAKNEDYPRKNWSSVILWNCQHPSNKSITPEFVQNSTGRYLHRFAWLTDDLIGELPIEWNWLVDEYGDNHDAKLIHYTLGTPCFEEFTNTPMSECWHSELKLASFFK
jgi:lipopolysaccharide biosynthesis glycosyltransferase